MLTRPTAGRVSTASLPLVLSQCLAGVRYGLMNSRSSMEVRDMHLYLFATIMAVMLFGL